MSKHIHLFSDGIVVGRASGWYPEVVREKAPIYVMGRVDPPSFSKPRKVCIRLKDFELLIDPNDQGAYKYDSLYLVDSAYQVIAGEFTDSLVATSSTGHDATVLYEIFNSTPGYCRLAYLHFQSALRRRGQ
jgi:hypothetical protein